MPDMTTTTQLDPAMIDTLDGPALAEAVAVHVMGFTEAPAVVGRVRLWQTGVVNGWESFMRMPDYRPDENIEQAWEVVERMKTIGQTDRQVWTTFVWKLDAATRGVHAIIENLSPTNICRAALKAVLARSEETPCQGR